MTKRPYSYTVLRYVHDSLTGEFVNVGVVIFCPSSGSLPAFLKGCTRKTISRLRDMFPDLKRSHFSGAMRAIDRGINRLAESLAGDNLMPRSGDAATFAKLILPVDDSALQWSGVGSGLTANPEQTLEKLYRRFVTRYDESQLARRSDEDVWKPVRLALEERNVPIELQKKTISGADDRIDFNHAWKNGAWHAYEPVSLDLADADGIYRKAHRWLGQLTSVAPDAAEAFRAYIIVGAPSDPDLLHAYNKAVRILQKSPKTEVFQESQIESLVNLIEDEVRAHQSH